MTSEEQNDNIYNVRYVWVVLYKDEFHNQTGPDYEVVKVFECESKVRYYSESFTPSYWQTYFKVVKIQLN